jgi:formate dehydrogenase major subunit
MECVVVQDLFLNETANYAHVFLPGATFLEKDGTFTNAERRINRVRKVMDAEEPAWPTGRSRGLRQALGYPMQYTHPSEIMDEIARADAELRRRELRPAGRWARSSGRATTRRRKARRSCMSTASCAARASSSITEYVPTDERTGPRFPLLLTTGRILSQYNVGARPAHRECRVARPGPAGDPSARCRAARHPRRRLGRSPAAPARPRCARGSPTGCAGRRLHHLPPSPTGANVVTTDFSDWATNCPEYKVTAVQVSALPSSRRRSEAGGLTPPSR